MKNKKKRKIVKARTRDLVGRPPSYKSYEKLEEKAIEYFEEIDKRQVENPLRIVSPTITGLVLHLGFCDRASFYDYERKPGFTNSIKKLRTMIENRYESLLTSPHVAGVIFALKNLGWSDRQILDHGVSDETYEKYKNLSVKELMDKANELISKPTGGNSTTSSN